MYTIQVVHVCTANTPVSRSVCPILLLYSGFYTGRPRALARALRSKVYEGKESSRSEGQKGASTSELACDLGLHEA